MATSNGKAPTSEQISRARAKAQLTQSQAAGLVHSTPRRWREWEAGDHRMHPGLWELFKIKTGGVTVFVDAP